MKLRLVIALACTCLALSACVVEPYRGADRPYYYYGGSYEYGRPVWRQ
jgi:hypothetical protein